jgi:hypothetical protein
MYLMIFFNLKILFNNIYMSASFGTTSEGNLYQQYFTQFKDYNLESNHPLIPNSQQYMFYKKYVSIHSEDRNIEKYPDSSEFEIEMPEDMLNVATIRLIQWTFPANYNTFSVKNGNVLLSFKIDNPFNPGASGILDEFNERIFQALWNNKDTNIEFIIEEGFYNPIQMATELTNKFNAATTLLIRQYFIEQNNLFPSDGWNNSITQLEQIGYNRFIIVYNSVSLKLWFGNNADGFTINNVVGTVLNEIEASNSECISGRGHVPDSSNWGLSGYLGLPRCNTSSRNGVGLSDISNLAFYNGVLVPRFYYGDVTPGDNGFWLLPNIDLSGCQVNWLEAFYKVNLMGDAFLYMELAGQNCIDETQPYNLSKFTIQTNQTNGVVNSAFAKLPVPSTPLSQWFDRDAIPYKYYYPPAERIRRLKIKLRYHNGRLANFGVFNFSFTLEFTLMQPQILRASKSVVYPPPMGR